MNLPTTNNLFHSNQPITTIPNEPPQEPQHTTATKHKPNKHIQHDKKITIYMTTNKLLDIEHTHLSLQHHQKLTINRNQLIQKTITITLTNLKTNNNNNVLMQQLTSQ